MMDDEEDDFPSDAAFEKMMAQFYLYERAIDVWLRTGKQNDKVMMDRLRGAYETAVDEWYALQ
jgi:hypothetical protein